jgi:Lrp/AsnC family leucine-responsive transcriptional regulator
MDAIDLRLIDLLRENGRSSYAELARQGRPLRAGRARAGRQAGGGRHDPAYRAEVDHEAIGLGVTALIGIVEDSGADTDDVLPRCGPCPRSSPATSWPAWSRTS